LTFPNPLFYGEVESIVLDQVSILVAPFDQVAILVAPSTLEWYFYIGPFLIMMDYIRPLDSSRPTSILTIPQSYGIPRLFTLVDV
jgi:hypothetical protein